MLNKDVRPRLYFVYILNIVSCFAVTVLHTTLPVFSPKPTSIWVKMVALQSMFVFAVPVFFMISGMNLLGYRQRESTKQFMKKRLWKVGRALVMASILCYSLFCLFPNSFYGANQYLGTGSILDFFRRFLTNQINDVYWFLYGIIYLYVLTPILSLVVTNKRCTEYMLSLCAVISVGIPLLHRLGVPSEYTSTMLGWPLFSSVSLLYFLAGYYLHVYWKPIKHQRLIAVGVYTASTIGMFLLGLWANGYKKPDGLSQTYDSYYVGTSSPLCVAQAFALFLLLQSCEDRLRTCNTTVVHGLQKIAGASLGVYLFHVLFINWVGVSADSRFVEYITSWPFQYAVLVYLCTLVAVLLGKKILSSCSSIVKRVGNRRTRLSSRE
ncbi:acyltransferase [Bifidobacterium pullorum subsp. saeculare]|uniref:acyltransferase n=1 Tax=Bifidobacterium pullorum TaxID=78448 RepID=UPI00195A7C2D|nr:acyltransferase [Bifidobacterium pullorum]MBM6706885.1 acyltransferase [Bifidobacterium pullorum subsp. saeculare]